MSEVTHHDDLLGKAFHNFMIALISLLMFSDSLVYFAEQASQPELFSRIPASR